MFSPFFFTTGPSFLFRPKTCSTPPPPLPASYNHATHHQSLISILCHQCVVSPMMSRENLKIHLDLSFMDSPLSGLVPQRRGMGCFLMSRYVRMPVEAHHSLLIRMITCSVITDH